MSISAFSSVTSIFDFLDVDVNEHRTRWSSLSKKLADLMSVGRLFGAVMQDFYGTFRDTKHTLCLAGIAAKKFKRKQQIFIGFLLSSSLNRIVRFACISIQLVATFGKNDLKRPDSIGMARQLVEAAAGRLNEAERSVLQDFESRCTSTSGVLIDPIKR
jgi:hypothetical protein